MTSSQVKIFGGKIVPHPDLRVGTNEKENKYVVAKSGRWMQTNLRREIIKREFWFPRVSNKSYFLVDK